MKRPIRRLYCAGTKKDFKYVIAPSKAAASAILGVECRVPDSDDIRTFWAKSNIASLSAQEREKKFGISRQALNYMRRRGGSDLPKIRDAAKKRRRARVEKILLDFPGLRFKEALKMSKVAPYTLKTVARQMGYKFAPQKRIPEDAELIQLATGRTWREFARIVGFTLATLRNHIYQRPELAEAIRKVRKTVRTGAASRGKLNLLKVRQLGQKGLSAYAIAEMLDCEQMTIRYHLSKWGKEFPNDFFPPYGVKRKTGRAVAGSDGGVADQP